MSLNADQINKGQTPPDESEKDVNDLSYLEIQRLAEYLVQMLRDELRISNERQGLTL
jgi:hypothetical protein